MSYERSSQAKHWSFATQREIDQMRGKARIEGENWLKEKQIDLQPLTSQDEQAFVALYISNMRKLCKKTELNPVLGESHGKYELKLFWTAAMLFKRFYLRNSMMNHNPVVMLTVAIYVAGKVEEIPLSFQYRGIRVDGLSRVSGVDKSATVELEVDFLAGCLFHMVVFPPTRPMFGYLDKLRTEQGQHNSVWKEIEDKTLEVLEEMLYTDLIFLHSPARLAFSSIIVAYDRLKTPPSFSKDELFQWMVPSGIQITDAAKQKIHELSRTLATGKDTFDKLIASIKNDNPGAKKWLGKWRLENEEYKNHRLRVEKRKR